MNVEALYLSALATFSPTKILWRKGHDFPLAAISAESIEKPRFNRRRWQIDLISAIRAAASGNSSGTKILIIDGEPSEEPEMQHEKKARASSCPAHSPFSKVKFQIH
jgi:hypothetical protein